MSKACSQCGAALSPDDIFCGACGSKVAPMTAESGEPKIETARAAESAKLPSLMRAQVRAVLLRILLFIAAFIGEFALEINTFPNAYYDFLQDIIEINFRYYAEWQHVKWAYAAAAAFLGIVFAYIAHLLLKAAGFELFSTTRQFIIYALPAFVSWLLFIAIFAA